MAAVDWAFHTQTPHTMMMMVVVVVVVVVKELCRRSMPRAE